ncbi:MAG: hypothetical protein WBD63_08370 [Phycisphaerae bacterium]|nr:hypothetical protein [Phycisphaerae bacterium]
MAPLRTRVTEPYTPQGCPRGRRHRRGNALLEFLLTLPILIFVTGLTIYMSLAMLTKQQALVDARHQLWHAAQYGGWSALKLEGWTPTQPTGDEEDYGNRPRGGGDELERLRPEIEPATVQKTSNADALEYWERLWGNLPGRHETHAERSFETQGSMWDFLARTAQAVHWRDSSPWHFHHLDAWKIARSGPLREIFDPFSEYLGGDVAEHFRDTRDDIIKRWFHGYDVLEDVAEGSG